MDKKLEKTPTWIEQIAEANERMTILADMGYMEEIAALFLTDGVVCVTECNPTEGGEDAGSGTIFSLIGFEKKHPDAVKAIRKFEDDTRCYVYAVIYREFDWGRLVCPLYVSKYADEWKSDKEELKKGTPYLYVIDLDNLNDCVYCSLQIACIDGGLHMVKYKSEPSE